MRNDVINRGFVILSMHAKMHRQLDAIESHYRGVLQEIEEKEILAYDNETEFSRLEALKKELLAIHFVERVEKVP